MKSDTHIALDFGDRRIGVAVGSPEAGLATPLEVITRADENDDGPVFRRLRQIVKSERASVIVVGDPLNMDGSAGARAEISRQFAKRLGQAIRQARVVLYDERLSSFAADERMEQEGVRPARRKEWRDAYAAAEILRDYFTALAKENTDRSSNKGDK